MKYTIGARGSQLSLAQTKLVISELTKSDPQINFDVKPIKTQGDTDSRPLFTIDQKGIFEKEIDRAVAQHEVDFAVHSLKDVPSKLDDDLTLACIPKREMVNDVFISADNSTLEAIKPNSVIGTSSLRRAVQISRKRPDVIVKPIRGNIETRIKKVSGENYDAIVLAQAGITRLGIDVSFTPLSIDDFYPSPGQGALAIVARKDDTKTIQMLKKIEDNDSRLEIEAERALSDFVDSGCRFPVGAYAKSNGQDMIIKVNAFSVDGQKSLYVTKTGSKDDPHSLGKKAGEELQQKGVKDLALNWREKVEEWNKK
ncbi:MAG: hydroxymethylbilane synthase [Nitrosopumilaceae archaeon]|uniref:Hydroxymethylbilane synthase n=4 Tax=Candidatus Nitrosomaritimum aestuariumsis TaxID=3342354 RepID=A0AC60W789_9ARCH|nr:hydroxymethylbilane synthase [Nitrosopumilaceae archaeon]MBA4459267.1 hydroxymethylbilane synthase [Nitrosopumilaceae archaeon]MBA4461597.1 hydroxymethylbilane synthase [Nitrosopumilaceae archaeon]MBA4463125.1 hydroxymethylbilane synthase [Nitrosopumilaceae archaeon]NCF21744.1 hydroxymethylbilane synthase [Nitrosopumilaceae archaeon]